MAMAKCVPAVLVLGSLAFAPVEGDAAARALKELQGEWRGVEMEAQGKRAPAAETQKFRVLIKGEEITFQPGPGARKSKFKLHPGRKPRGIDLIPQDGPDKGKTVKGIYALEKGRLRLCAANYGGDINRRPKAFRTEAGDGRALLVLERVKKK
jgi:uncharacterized protein (TIGR03067 family)